MNFERGNGRSSKRGPMWAIAVEVQWFNHEHFAPQQQRQSPSLMFASLSIA